MSKRFLIGAAALGSAVLGLAGPALAAAPPVETTKRATFGAGCFWSVEAVFERIPGVKSVISGFAGGTVPNPSYAMVGTGDTGHAEVVQLEYDPEVVAYETLLKVFFAVHDPTTLNRQGDDFGTQYRSIILYHDDDQKQAALALYRALTARRSFHSPIVTQLVPQSAFFPAEPYHQDYYRNHRDSEYSQLYIVPKLRKMKHKWETALRPRTPPAGTSGEESERESPAPAPSKASARKGKSSSRSR